MTSPALYVEFTLLSSMLVNKCMRKNGERSRVVGWGGLDHLFTYKCALPCSDSVKHWSLWSEENMQACYVTMYVKYFFAKYLEALTLGKVSSRRALDPGR
jgi:hypothetical protein